MSVRRMGVKVPPSKTALEAATAASDTLMKGAREVQRKFTEPDDDWRPMWLVVTPTQGTVITPESMTNAAEREAVVRTVARFARERGAVAIGHLHSTWHVPPEKLSEERQREVFAQVDRQDGSTEGIPEREEAVMIALYTATTFRLVMAPIGRHEGAPPTLGEFTAVMTSEDEEAELSGRMVDPLRAALRRLG
jgi:hypothetical protein